MNRTKAIVGSLILALGLGMAAVVGLAPSASALPTVGTGCPAAGMVSSNTTTTVICAKTPSDSKLKWRKVISVGPRGLRGPAGVRGPQGLPGPNCPTGFALKTFRVDTVKDVADLVPLQKAVDDALTAETVAQKTVNDATDIDTAAQVKVAKALVVLLTATSDADILTAKIAYEKAVADRVITAKVVADAQDALAVAKAARVAAEKALADAKAANDAAAPVLTIRTCVSTG